MFTGIIESLASVHERSDSQLIIERPESFDDITIGCSIAVSGVCLSVVAFDEKAMTFDVIDETWGCTDLGQLQPGDRVNLERAMKATDRFEGHIVQGHCEGIGEIVAKDADAISILIPEALQRFLAQKGSIAIDGISLTVASIENDICTIALIPHTVEHTTLGIKQVTDKVHIETDILVRHIEALLPS